MKEKLNAIFGDPKFLAENRSLDNFEDIYSSVLTRDGTVTRDELQSYLEQLSSQMQIHEGDELTENELSNVAGGGIGVVVAAKMIAGCYTLGYGLGKFIYNVSHR